MKTLISVVGTTGIGKTKLAIELAKQFNTEIISCDSRQFFSEMKIGTAAPSEDELSQAKHHFIGQLSVKDYYSIGQFEHDSLELLDQLFEKYDIVIMVGGSMMYEKAVIEGLNDLPEANEKNQEKLETIWRNEGIEKLQEMLKDLDSEYYENVDIHNQRRLLRAIDIIWQTGKTYSENISHDKNPRNFQTIRIGIEAPRETVYERINLRVDKMMENRLLDEAKNLDELRKSQEGRNLASLNTVGYSELFKYFDGEWDFDFAVSEIKKNSRRFAKRQLTWYRKEENIHYIKASYSEKDFNGLIEYIDSKTSI